MLYEFIFHIIIIGGLCLFETISSIDNAIVNAEVLSTMGQKARHWFLLWGLLFAVFVVRGLLPWAIVWAVTPIAWTDRRAVGRLFQRSFG